jgi:hypothetical protein
MTEDDNDPEVIHLAHSVEMSDKEIDEWFQRLVELKSSNAIAYDREKKRLAKVLQVTVAAVDARVDQLSKGTSLEEKTTVAKLVVYGLQHSKLWHDQGRRAYATFKIDRHLEHHQVEQNGDYWKFLFDLYGEEHKIGVGDELYPIYPTRAELGEATYQLGGHARRDVLKKPRCRMLWHEGALWLDLGNADWSAVRVTSEAWEVVPIMDAPIIRGQGILPLPDPIRGGDISELREFTNVHSEEDFVLFCGSTAALFCPFGDYTTTIFSGPAGSGKTTATLVMRGLIDPHLSGSRALTGDGPRNLMIAGCNSHVIALENISVISDQVSDAICRLNTGASYAERKYYTNDGSEHMWQLHCPVLINGIPENLAERSDLADRVVAFTFPLIGDKFQGKDRLTRRYEEAKPRILGVLLDGVVAALKVRERFGGDSDTAARELLDNWRPRFLDFGVWGEAACRGMGFPEGAFKSAYRNNLGYALRYLAEHNPVCVGVRKLMEGQAEWIGYPEQLYQEIRPYSGVGLRGASWLAREDLPRAIPLLLKVHGIGVTMKSHLVPGDNKNGIKIHKGIGTHFEQTFVEGARDAEEVGPEMGTDGYPESEPPKPPIKRRA